MGANLKSAPGWGEYQALVPFLTAPSKASLVETLQQLAKHGREAIPSLGWPWVLVSLLREEEEGVPFEVLAQEVARGQFGDIGGWKLAEQRWQADGLRVVDFEQWSSGRYLNADIGTQGVCFPATLMHTASSKWDLAEFLPLLNSIGHPTKTLRLLEILVGAVRRNLHSPLKGSFLADARNHLFQEALRIAKEVPFPNNLRILNFLASVPELWELPEFLDLANDIGYRWTSLSAPWNVVVPIFNGDPSRRGLLSLIAARLRRFPQHESVMLEASGFEALTGDSPSIRYSVARLRLGFGNWNTCDIDSIVADLGPNPEHVLHSSASNPKLKNHESYGALLRVCPERSCWIT